MFQIQMTLNLPDTYKPQTIAQTHKFLVVMHEAARIFAQRQEKYGINNISKFGDMGVVVRLSDKIERLVNSYFHQASEVDDETVEDTLMDIANYALIAVMAKRGYWDGPIPDMETTEVPRVLPDLEDASVHDVAMTELEVVSELIPPEEGASLSDGE